MNTLKKLYIIPLFILLSITLSAQTFTISGNISTAENQVIPNVKVDLTAGTTTLTTTTDAQGNYEFTNVPTNQASITIIPSRNDEPLNGVSTFDFVVIARHILGLDILDSNDKYLAADINKSGTITAFDLVTIRALILAKIIEFPEINSWRFVEKNQLEQLPVLNGDYTNDFRTSFELDGNSNAFSFDFIGIKVGDINYNAVP